MRHPVDFAFLCVGASVLWQIDARMRFFSALLVALLADLGMVSKLRPRRLLLTHAYADLGPRHSLLPNSFLELYRPSG